MNTNNRISKMLKSAVYRAGNVVINRYLLTRVSLMYFFLGMDGLVKAVQELPSSLIVSVLTKYGAQIGKDTVIERGLLLHNSRKPVPFINLQIGEGVFLGRNVFMDLSDKIIIENYTAIGAGCMLWTHVGDYSKKLYGGDYHEKRGSIVIKESIICYSNTIIGQGVCIGPFSRVGAGSVVLKDVPSHTLVAGNPAREIRKLLN